MISQDKPNVVFVPGAWHDSNVYSLLLPSLQQAGYRSFMVNLPSVGAEPPSTSISEDITAVRSKVQEAIDDRGGSDVLVVLHSYGGAPGSSALKGLAKGEMEGKGGVVHVLYIAAYVLEEGTATGDIKGDGDTRGPSALSRYHIEGDHIYVVPDQAADMFYHDVDPELQAKAIASLKHHSLPTFSSPVTYAAWKHIPSTYLLCSEDRILPFSVQKRMVDDAGVRFGREYLESGHSPFLSQPEAVVACIRRAAGELV